MNPIQLRERLLFIRGKINLRRNINFYSWCLILIQYASWARYGIFFIYINVFFLNNPDLINITILEITPDMFNDLINAIHSTEGSFRSFNK